MDEPTYQSESYDINTIKSLLNNHYKNETHDIKDKVNKIIEELIQEKKIIQNGSQRLY